MDNDKPTIASKWNARYQWEQSSKLEPAAILLQHEAQLPNPVPANATALDLACGRGASTFWLAQHGFNTSAWDVSESAINLLALQLDQMQDAKSLQVQPLVRDVIENPPEANTFDVIVVSRFLHRPLCDAIAAALKPNGLLFYQTFIAGLSNPDYLLSPDELPQLFATLEPVHYEEITGKANSDKPASVMAHLVARKTAAN